MHSFFRESHSTPAERYKSHLLVKEGFMTSRQGYPAIELGYPITVREDLPQHRSRDGSQMGPVFHNPALPWHAHENAKGGVEFRHHHALSRTQGGPGFQRFHPLEVITHIEQTNDSFKNGHFYPYKRNHNIHYETLPQGDWVIPPASPSNFHHKSDELRKWLLGVRN